MMKTIEHLRVIHSTDQIVSELQNWVKKNPILFVNISDTIISRALAGHVPEMLALVGIVRVAEGIQDEIDDNQDDKDDKFED